MLFAEYLAEVVDAGKPAFSGDLVERLLRVGDQPQNGVHPDPLDLFYDRAPQRSHETLLQPARRDLDVIGDIRDADVEAGVDADELQRIDDDLVVHVDCLR